MKTPLFSILCFILLVFNNLMFNVHDEKIIHAIQVVFGIALFVAFIKSILYLSKNYLSKNYEILSILVFIVGARNTESLVRKALIAYYPIFYNNYKLYIFVVSVAVFVGLMWIWQRKIAKGKIVKVS